MVVLFYRKNISGVCVLKHRVVVFCNCILHEWMHWCWCVVWVCECRKTQGCGGEGRWYMCWRKMVVEEDWLKGVCTGYITDAVQCVWHRLRNYRLCNRCLCKMKSDTCVFWFFFLTVFVFLIRINYFCNIKLQNHSLVHQEYFGNFLILFIFTIYFIYYINQISHSLL